MVRVQSGDVKVVIGQCYCGKVKYEFEGPVKFVAHDHCSICRQTSGAAFVTWVGVSEAQFRLAAGREHLTSFWSTPDAERQFCATCGSHLFFRSARWPGEVHLTLSTVVHDHGLHPMAHVFYSDKAPWIEVRDDLPRYGGKSGVEPLP